jgi:TM2 domain-containing membrane protein YozV
MRPHPTPDAPAINKTVAVWLALLLGMLGVHQFYVRGWRTVWGWLHWPVTLAGLVGLRMVLTLGTTHGLIWVLLPLLGVAVAVPCLTAIVWALSKPEDWNRRFNPARAPSDKAGATHALTVWAVVPALLVGAVAFTSSLVISFQGYFEAQVQAARAISQ